ncbi:flap endonuclease GEN [Phymastichus coffea]|uniref:flap endonuclease GEN n=1 Tax=Phymastichus coffea TaxID=108790 RepID=UPI00273C49B8|nr:flap endonuclease GEN [Phymastichus coffea]XP_058802866.1 flap endonuclease GEN [Phymastichus coffea]XP_058802867.1 flap endonuclease GEN [Phymastichus coffea]
MGVKDLWNILSPVSERKPLFELQGKAIAIDLSCWVVDSQNITDNATQPKMYLRNLFFRTSYLLLHDIFPIFVLEGEAPTLKHRTIAKRNEIRHGGEEKKKSKKGVRSHFNHVLKECEEMLRYMGIACIKGYGEAEAMCAYLNADGLVDGCISQDSDCFLYGAKTVYRNFCTSTQGNRTTSGGSIDEYSMSKIRDIFNLSRNKMIALALLCGCDYDEGLNGVGKEAALKLFKVIDGDDILDRMKEWRTNSSKYRKMEIELSNPNICTNCGHSGKMRSHTRIGCADCGTSVKCSDSYKEKRTLIANELAIRKKALQVENFPSQELIDEFLQRKGSIPTKLDLQWKKPEIVQFIGFMERKVQWEASYTFAKIFPLMTRWQLLNLIEFPIEQRLTKSGVFVPEKIKKIRNIRSVASYEILWLDRDNILKGLILTPPECNKENDEEYPDALSELATIEPQEIVTKCYPQIVENFKALRYPKKKKTTRSRKKKVIDENGEEVQVEKKKPERKKRAKSKIELTNNRKIVDFVVTNPPLTLEESFSSITITPKRQKKDESMKIKKGPQFDRVMTIEKMDTILNGSLERMFNELTPEDFPSDVEDSMEMSLIIDNIINRRTPCKEISIDYQEIKQNSSKTPQVFTDYRTTDTAIFPKTACKEEADEFNLLDDTYVPLDKRVYKPQKRHSSVFSTPKLNNSDDDKLSFGIESLLNGTDD